MIIGTGTDLTDISRIEKTFLRHDSRFITRCFTKTEQEKAERRRGTKTHISTYAKRFAAKEACAKALGTGFNHGVYMKDIGVVNDENGKPVLNLTGGAKTKLDEITPAGKKAVVHLALTDELPYAKAMVIIEAL